MVQTSTGPPGSHQNELFDSYVNQQYHNSFNGDSNGYVQQSDFPEQPPSIQSNHLHHQQHPSSDTPSSSDPPSNNMEKSDSNPDPSSSSSSAPSSSILGPAPLKRNMACLTCRKRKLRCDAAKPVCGTCAKSRSVAIANNHPPPVPEGDCIYGDTKLDDLPTGLAPIPTGSKRGGKRSRDQPHQPDALRADVILRAKDEQIAQLEEQVRQLQLVATHALPSEGVPLSASFAASQPLGPSAEDAQNATPSPSSIPGLGSRTLQQPSQPPRPSQPPPDPMLELLWSGYPKDLPPPDTVLHLCEIFFSSSPYRNIIYKPGFMASLLLPPNHPNRPHAGLLHAVVAVAVPLSPYYRPKDDDQDPVRKMARIHKRVDMVVGMGTSPPVEPSSRRDISNLSFSEYHLAMARQKSEMALLIGAPNPLDWCQALVLVAYQLRVDERALETYLMAACCARLSTPSGLTRMNADRKHAETLPNSYLVPPKTLLEEHERRSYFWHLYLVEAYTSGGVQFFHSTYDDSAITTTFPIRMEDFQRGLDPPANLQNLHSPDIYSNLSYDDDFLLHLKAAILCKRTYRVMARYNLEPHVDISQAPDFQAIERDTLTFLRKIPPLDFSLTVQVERLVAVLDLHTIIIHLYQDMKGSHTHRSEVIKRLEASVAAVVQIAHSLNASSFDMALLHFRTFNGLGVTAKVICHEINESLSAQASGRTHARDALLGEAVQALDAILMVLRRCKDRIPYAGRFEALLSKFRSGGWDKASIDRTMAIYHVYKAQRDNDNKPDPQSGKTGDLWSGDDRFGNSWRLQSTKYERVGGASSRGTSAPGHRHSSSVSSDGLSHAMSSTDGAPMHANAKHGSTTNPMASLSQTATTQPLSIYDASTSTSYSSPNSNLTGVGSLRGDTTDFQQTTSNVSPSVMAPGPISSPSTLSAVGAASGYVGGADISPMHTHYATDPYGPGPYHHLPEHPYQYQHHQQQQHQQHIQGPGVDGSHFSLHHPSTLTSQLANGSATGAASHSHDATHYAGGNGGHLDAHGAGMHNNLDVLHGDPSIPSDGLSHGHFAGPPPLPHIQNQAELLSRWNFF